MNAALHGLAIVSLGLGGLSAIAVVIDLVSGHRQPMWIMNVVWPVTALWSGPLGLWAYARWGRTNARVVDHHAPFPARVAKATSHCGAGCTLGDLAAELLTLAAPLTLFGHRLFGAWIYGIALAFAFGIAFQYFTLKPMRHLSPVRGLVAALKADTLSLLAWQVGMYGWMAVAVFVIFRHPLGHGSAVFWSMMQLAMLCGFATAYPVNWWLLRRGVKDAM